MGPQQLNMKLRDVWDLPFLGWLEARGHPDPLPGDGPRGPRHLSAEPKGGL